MLLGLALASIFLAVRVSAIIPDADQTVTFSSALAAAPGKCFSASGNFDGAPVVLGDCAPTANNSWIVGFNGGGHFRVFGNKCLDVKDGNNANGARLQVWTCSDGNANQNWAYSAPNSNLLQLKWAGKNKCVDLSDGKLTNGNPLQIWDCDANNNNQRWDAAAVTLPIFFKIHPNADTIDSCIGVKSKGVNASVVIVDCGADNDSSQFFTDPLNNGQIRPWNDDPNANLCIAPLGLGTASGTKLVTVLCDENAGKDGKSTHQWSFTSGETSIVNRATNGFINCIDLTDGGGKPLQIWDCSPFGGGPNDNQKWQVSKFYDH